MYRNIAMVCCALALLAGGAELFAQAGEFFPATVGYTWTYETTVTGVPSVTETQEFAETTVVDGKKACVVQPAGGGGALQTMYAFEGTDAFVRYSALPSPLDTMIGVLPSQWYTMFRFVSTSTPSWTVFRYDTVMTIDGVPVPVRILVTGKMREIAMPVTVPAGMFMTDHIDITSQVGTYLGPIFIPFVTLVDSFWISPGTWIVKSVREDVGFTFDSSSFTIPGTRRELLSYGPPVAVDEGSAQSKSFTLEGNYPNPFNPSTVIRYSLPEAAVISLRVFDILGREVAVLADGMEPAGEHETIWNGLDNGGASVPSGVYYCRLSSRGSTQTTKMVLLR